LKNITGKERERGDERRKRVRGKEVEIFFVFRMRLFKV